MNKLSQINQTVIIRITKLEQKYFVSIKPFNQVKQTFCNKSLEESYKHIILFLMGYSMGHIEEHSVNLNKLKKFINNINKLFTIDIKLLID